MTLKRMDNVLIVVDDLEAVSAPEGVIDDPLSCESFVDSTRM